MGIVSYSIIGKQNIPQGSRHTDSDVGPSAGQLTSFFNRSIVEKKEKRKKGRNVLYLRLKVMSET